MEEYGRYVPSVYRDAGGDLTGFVMVGEGKDEEAGAAAAGAAETRWERAEEEGELEEGRQRAGVRREKERERERVNAEKKKSIDRRAAPDVYRFDISKSLTALHPRSCRYQNPASHCNRCPS